MCLDIHAKFRGDRPLRGRDLKGGSNWPPPPSKNKIFLYISKGEEQSDRSMKDFMNIWQVNRTLKNLLTGLIEGHQQLATWSCRLLLWEWIPGQTLDGRKCYMFISKSFDYANTWHTLNAWNVKLIELQITTYNLYILNLHVPWVSVWQLYDDWFSIFWCKNEKYTIQ